MKRILIKPGFLTGTNETDLNQIISSVINANGFPIVYGCCNTSTTPLNGQILGFNGTTGKWEAINSGVAGVTNLAYVSSALNGVVTNSAGTGLTIPLATVTNAGLSTPAMFGALQNSTATQAQLGLGDTYFRITDPGTGAMEWVIDGTQVMALSPTKVSFNGLLIDPPSGLELMLKTSNPGGIQANTLWLNSVTNHLMRGSVDLETLGLSTTLTGLSTSTASTITATDTTLVALGKLQAQVDTKIDNSIIAAKGDILIGTANDTPSILTVGTDAQILTADSTAPGGLKWSSPAATVIPDASETVKGIVELSTSAETETGTSTVLAITPAAGESTYIKKSIGNTKGDVISFTSDNTPAILNVGSNGQSLVADSTTATGLKWETIDSTKNRVHISSASITPTTPLTPTVTEIQTYVTANTLTGTLVYYTGTTTATDAPSYAYWVDKSGVVTLVEKPSISPVFATNAETETGTSTSLFLNPANTEATYIKKTFGDNIGDLLVWHADNDPGILAKGSTNEVLTVDPTNVLVGLSWKKAIAYRYTAALAFVADGADFKMDIPQATHLCGLYPIVVVQEDVAGVFKDTGVVVETTATGDVTIKVTAPTFTGRVIIM